ncbi:hypothetical protein [Marinifilum sp.]|uniref:hypothetical protein n=1 Tax=Marinifilum sp. TaxID=2033137 RepID=UPI003BAB74E3
MKYINKSEAPRFYRDKVRGKIALIQTMFANGDSRSDIWSEFWNNKNGSKQKKRLRECLLVDQGYVCCYCGRRINIQETVIEHLEPKENADRLTNFNNLYASCSGGNQTTIIAGSMTLNEICQEYSTTSGAIYALNGKTSFQNGEEIKVPKDGNGGYCDHKKNADTIRVKPNQTDVADRFQYSNHVYVEDNKNKTGIGIDAHPNDDEDVTNTIDTLNLNHQTLLKRRRDFVKKMNLEIKGRFEKCANDNDVLDVIERYIGYYGRKNGGRYEPFYFVCLFDLQKKKDKILERIGLN